MLFGSSSIVVEQLSEPHNACVWDNDSRPLTVCAFLCNLEVSAPGISFQVQVEQFGLDLQDGGTSMHKTPALVSAVAALRS